MSLRPQAHPHEDPHHPHWPLAAVLFGFVLLLGVFSAHDSSTWLHVRTGAEILARRALPGVDAFSYTMAGRPWTTDSWLADALFGLLDRLGPWALIGLKAVALAAAFALLLPLNAGSPLAAAGVLALGAAAAWPGMAETSGCFDFPLLALLIRVLRPKRAFAWSTAALVFLIALLWSNLHASTAALALWVAGLKAAKNLFQGGRKRRWAWTALPLAALAGLGLNPLGPAAAFGLFAGAPAALPASAWSLYGLLALAGAAACWVCLQTEFLLALTAAGLLALSAAEPGLRPLYCLAACPLIAVALGHFVPPWRQTPAAVARLALLLAGLFALHWHGAYARWGRGRGYGSPAMAGAAAFLRAEGLTGRMFNDVEAGDELLARGGPPVFVDSRAALYGPAFMEDARSWPTAFRSLDQAYGFDYAVLRNRPGLRALAAGPEWSLAYEDPGARVYRRRRSGR